MTIFRPKPWVTPLEKCQFFDFSTFCFYSLERRFFALEYRKRHFPALYCLKKKKLEKWPFLDQNYGLTPLEIWPFFDRNHGLTPLQKCQFLDFLNLLFL